MSKKSLFLVLIQFACFAFFALDGHLFAKGSLLIIQILGVGIGLWGIAAMRIGNVNIQPEVKPNAVFVSSGPYKIIRNPMYSGILIFFGMSVINHFTLLRLAILLLLATVLLMKIFMEEQFLIEKFGIRYEQYKQKTHRLIPFIF
ncbi:MAG TPA: isoprenylcysteine carboxylmethyltransferase family protein [Flavobacteriia bacterium]|nr:isoprenylcysteine carboxylmethyltransferase family protein [Flavobacteriia bacterium]